MDSPKEIYKQLLAFYGTPIDNNNIQTANYLVGYASRLNNEPTHDIKTYSDPAAWLSGWEDADGDIKIWEGIWEE